MKTGDVAFVPVGGHQHLGRVAGDFAQQLGHRPGDPDRVFALEVGQQLDPEADVALLVGGDVLHPFAEGGELVAFLQVAADEVLPGWAREASITTW